MDIKVEIMPSGEKKLGANWDNILGEIIGEVALQTETECKKEAPVRTGSLMRGHSTKRNGPLEASIHNNMNYWTYVVYGTYKMAANNYPQRALDRKSVV